MSRAALQRVRSGSARVPAGRAATHPASASPQDAWSVTPAPPPRLQFAKLVTSPADPDEVEAERIASAVMAAPSGTGIPEGPGAPQGAAPQPNPSGGAVHRRTTEGTAPGTTPGLHAQLSRLNGGGEPLPAGERAFFEPRFGYDFSGVRVHADAEGGALASDLRATAFTSGQNIVFASGAYQPGSHAGRRLIAHELVHTIQQGASPVRGAPAAAMRAPTAAVQRWPDWLDKGVNAISSKASDLWEGGKKLVKKGVDLAKQGWAYLKQKAIAFVTAHIHKMPGWTLLTQLLGRNPISGKDVKRNPGAILEGLLKMTPLGWVLSRMKGVQGAMNDAFTWVERQFKALGLTWTAIKSRLASTWDKLVRASPTRYLGIVADAIAGELQRVKTFALRLGGQVFEIMFQAALKLVGGPVQGFLGVIKKGKDVFSRIVNDPVGFLKNLLGAVKMGVGQFSANLMRHLQKGLMEWLFGTISKAGITLPEKFDVPGIFSLVLQILNLTYSSIREKLVTRLGAPVVARLEQAWEFLKILVTGGPLALWEHVKEQLSGLKDTLFAAARDWVITQVAKAALEKLATLWNPAGAIVQAVITTYNTVMFFIERAKQIAAFVNAVLNSIGNIAAGNIKGAADWIETSLAKAIPVILGFLARFIGLGDVSERIRGVIQTIRAPVDKAVDKVLDFIVRKGKALLQAGKRGLQRAGEKIKSWVFPAEKISAPGEDHTLSIQVKGKAVQARIASTPQAVVSFLLALDKKYGVKDKSAYKTALGHAKDLDSMQLPAETKSTEGRKAQRAVRSKQRALAAALNALFKSAELAGMLAKEKVAEIYKLEGVVDQYRSIPQIKDDKMTPDHEPQYELLKRVAEMKESEETQKKLFEGTQAVEIAKSRGSRGMAINMSDMRHKMTYEETNSSKVQEAEGKMKNKRDEAKSVPEKREAVLKVLDERLEAQSERTKNIYREKNNFGDIKGLKLEDPKQKENLITEVQAAGIKGAEEIRKQDVYRLGRPQ